MREDITYVLRYLIGWHLDGAEIKNSPWEPFHKWFVSS